MNPNNIRFIMAVLSKKKYLFIALLSSFSFLSVFLFLTNFDLMLSNLGFEHTAIYVALSILVILLFGLYVSLFIFRWRERQGLSAGTVSVGVVGTGSSVLVTGCAACGITLASYLGLASVLSFLPFYGLELTFLGTVLLGFSIKKLSDENPINCDIKQ